MFYGANTGLPQTKILSSAINKCSTANEQVKSDVCKIVKTALKFNNPNYEAASKDLTSIEYTFQTIGAFYNNFLYCLNDQNSSVTTSETIRNVDHLLFQLNTFVLNGIDIYFANSAESLGAVFGERTRDILLRLTDQFKAEFSSVGDNLLMVRENFISIANEGGTISVDTINATISMEAFNSMITAFKDIEVSTKQFSSVVFNFLSITTALEKVTSFIATLKDRATLAINQGDFSLDVSIQASKNLFATKSLALQNDVDVAFNAFQIIAAQMFSGDEDVFTARTTAEQFVMEIKKIFDDSSNEFLNFFTDQQLQISRQISDVKTKINEYTLLVTDFIASSVSTNSGSFAKCFETTENTDAATALIDSIGRETSECINQQTNTSLTAQSLLTFISEDTVLEVRLRADRLCACAVKGDKKTEEKAKRCFKRVRNIQRIIFILY